MSTQSVPHAPAVNAEQLTRTLRLVHLALAGLTVLHGNEDLNADLLPIQEAAGDALTLAEAIEDAGAGEPEARHDSA